ncbi:hypothetical protein IHO40_05090 [Wolbachia endosymbiont of Mansonella ozzardi]|uniref:hypothetical protein n=1 Tax=Wolbachia endosymbiont of Mansonella ozzardi TaxID=137464 RepID=UPI001CE04AD2|nr:hypothetical protein [Wolbachia endosymbiont of Mansonella ozzardi]MCA4775427.1 hypothetical protein [Wolbachia endosymbiont of Mansonella ozzardi]
MTTGLTFYKNSQRQAADKTSDLNETKVIVYEDGGGNKYILDASGISNLSNIDDIKLSNLLKAEVKFKYHPSDGKEAEKKGLGNIIGTLFAIKNSSTANSKTILEKEIAKEPVVDAIFSIKENAGDAKSIFAEEIAKKVDVTGAILGATDVGGKKSILVEKLGGFLASRDEVKYDSAQNSPNQAAKAFLESKGLASASDAATQLLDDDNETTLATAVLDVKKDATNPTLETALAANRTLQNGVAGNLALKTAVAADEGFRSAVTSTLAKPADIAAVPALQNAVAGSDTLKTAIITNTAFQDAVAGKKVLHDSVTTRLLTGNNTGKLGTAILNTKSTDDKTLVEQLAQIPDFKNGTKIQANAEDLVFQSAVRDVMSKPVFDIPTDASEPLNWEW